eukprot:m.112958 g.112958  ORF g.112958 m.112958 type:complete len:89 (-) comp15429_c2_seq1:2578-2844(-)
MAQHKYKTTVDIPFPSERLATIACNTLRVDKEPNASRCSRSVSVEGSTVHIAISADELKLLRVSVNWTLDMALLSLETMQAFDQGDNA